MLRLRLLAAAAVLSAGAAHAATLAVDGAGAGGRLVAGTRAAARWSGAIGGREAELLLSLDGGRAFPLRLTREGDPSSGSFSFRVPNFPTRKAAVALRSEENGFETIRAVSAEFAIEADPLARSERIVPFGGDLALGEAAHGAHGSPLRSGVASHGPSLSALEETADSADVPAVAAHAPALAPSGDAAAPAVPRADDPASFRAAVCIPRRE